MLEIDFRTGVSADGTRLMIGMFNADNNGCYNTTASGKVRFFEYDSKGSKWSKFATDLSGKGADIQFGFALTMNYDGSQVAIGSYRFNN